MAFETKIASETTVASAVKRCQPSAHTATWVGGGGMIIKTEILAEIKYDADVKMYIAYVPSLGIYSQGYTADQAEVAINDAVKSYLTVMHEKGLILQKKER